MQHQSGLLSDQMYEHESRAVGFAFSSDAGLDFVALMRASSLGNDIWEVIAKSAEQARAYCLNPNNKCAARFEAARKSGNSTGKKPPPIRLKKSARSTAGHHIGSLMAQNAHHRLGDELAKGLLSIVISTRRRNTYTLTVERRCCIDRLRSQLEGDIRLDFTEVFLLTHCGHS